MMSVVPAFCVVLWISTNHLLMISRDAPLIKGLNNINKQFIAWTQKEPLHNQNKKHNKTAFLK